MSERKAILVTGGAGFVGSHFVWSAVDAGRDVVVLDDLSGGAPARLPAKARLVIGDIGDRDMLRHIITQYSIGVVAHFAGKIQVGESVRNPAMYFDINVARSLRLLEVLRDAEVRVCLFSSSAAVYGNPELVPIPEAARLQPLNPYGATKLAIEMALEAWASAHGLRWAALRYFNAAGAHPDGTLRENHRPETHLIPLALDAGIGVAPPISVFGSDYDTPDGTCVRDYVHVQDLAAAHLAALTKLEAGTSIGPLNLGTGRGHSVKQVIEAAARVLRRDVPFSMSDRRIGDAAVLVADPANAKRVLGWQPTRSDLETMLEDALRSRL